MTSVAFLVEDEAQVRDPAVANAGDELAVSTPERIVRARHEPPPVLVQRRAWVQRAQPGNCFADTQTAAGAPYAIEHLDGVWLDIRGRSAGIVARVRKAAEGREVATDPPGLPGDVTFGAGLA